MVDIVNWDGFGQLVRLTGFQNQTPTSVSYILNVLHSQNIALDCILICCQVIQPLLISTSLNYSCVCVLNRCSRLGLVCLAYMWRRDQSELLKEMVACGLDAILIKVAAIGLQPRKHLGKSLTQMVSYLEKMVSQEDDFICPPTIQCCSSCPNLQKVTFWSIFCNLILTLNCTFTTILYGLI